MIKKLQEQLLIKILKKLTKQIMHVNKHKNSILQGMPPYVRSKVREKNVRINLTGNYCPF